LSYQKRAMTLHTRYVKSQLMSHCDCVFPSLAVMQGAVSNSI
jgi:hypothetical protein